MVYTFMGKKEVVVTYKRGVFFSLIKIYRTMKILNLIQLNWH